MPDKEMLNWVKDQQNSGFSDDKIRQALLDQGYDKDKIEEILASSTGTEKADKKPASKYAVFYILFTILNPVLIITTFAIPFLTISGVIIYLSTFMYAAIIGVITAYVFYRNCDSLKEYINHTLASSIILSIILAIINMIGEITGEFAQTMKGIAQEGVSGGSLLKMFNYEAVSNNTLHIITLIIFMLPILYYFMKRDDKQRGLLILYIIPLITYLILIFILRIITRKLL